MKHKGLFLLFTILLTLFAASPVVAQQIQKFHVESFRENPFDMSAREKPTSRDDGTGTLYAIIKVRSTDPEDNLGAYKFDFDYLKDIEEKHNGSLWVYVQNGAKTMNIEREGFSPVERYNLGTTLQPGKVYDLVLKPEPKVIAMQNLLFVVEPADSKAMIMYAEEGGNEKLFGQVDEEGCAFKKLVLGRYSYKIISENYHDSEGVVTLSTPSGKHTEKVTLRPNFSHITLTVEGGAEIYINEKKQGTGQWSGNLAPGTYSIECRKANHKSTLETITVEDGKNTTYTLKAPTPIVGSLSISSTPLRAQIAIDGKPVGETPEMIDGLIIGNHKITVSKEGYETATADIAIKENETVEKNIVLAKKASSAKLRIYSTPTNAAIKINGKELGSTPYTADLPLGKYKVKVTKDGYRSGRKRLVLDEKGVSHNFELKNRRTMPLKFGVGGSLLNYSFVGFEGGYEANVGINMRLGNCTNLFNLTIGTELGARIYRFGLYSNKKTFSAGQIVFPIMLKVNYLKDDDCSMYLGIGYEGGVTFAKTNNYNSFKSDIGEKVYNAFLNPSRFVVELMGFYLFNKIDIGLFTFKFNAKHLHFSLEFFDLYYYF